MGGDEGIRWRRGCHDRDLPGVAGRRGDRVHAARRAAHRRGDARARAPASRCWTSSTASAWRGRSSPGSRTWPSSDQIPARPCRSEPPPDRPSNSARYGDSTSIRRTRVLYTACMSATRTQVYFTDEQRRRSMRPLRREGVTLAEIVRRAVDTYLGDRPDPSSALDATFGADRRRPSPPATNGPWLTSWSTPTCSSTTCEARAVSSPAVTGSTTRS